MQGAQGQQRFFDQGQGGGAQGSGEVAMMPERVNPTGVVYSRGAIPVATAATSRISKFYPINGREFKHSATNVVQLQLADPSAFLDASGHSFLKFDVMVTGGTDKKDVYMGSGGAHGWIRRLRVLSSTGQQLEDIDDYNALNALMMDLQCSPDHVGRVLNAREGSGIVPGTGDLLDGTGGSRTFCINPMCGLLSTDKYLPLLATKAGIMLEFHLEDPNVWLVSSSGEDIANVEYTLQNIEYVAELVDFGPAFNDQFMMGLQESNGVLLSSTTYRNHTLRLTSAGSSETLSIAERARSIKSIFTICREDGEYGKILYDSLGDRSRAQITGYQYRVGSRTYPDHIVKCGESNASESLSQAYKALGGALTDVHHGSLISSKNFVLSGSATTGRKFDGVPSRHHDMSLELSGDAASKNGATGFYMEAAAATKLFVPTEIGNKIFAVGIPYGVSQNLINPVYGAAYAAATPNTLKAGTQFKITHIDPAEGGWNLTILKTTASAVVGAANDVVHFFLDGYVSSGTVTPATQTAMVSDTSDDLAVLDARGTACFAVSLESTSQDSTHLESGLNSAAQALPIEVAFDKDSGGSQACRVNAFVMCDAIFSFMPGGEVLASV